MKAAAPPKILKTLSEGRPRALAEFDQSCGGRVGSIAQQCDQMTDPKRISARQFSSNQASILIILINYLLLFDLITSIEAAPNEDTPNQNHRPNQHINRARHKRWLEGVTGAAGPQATSGPYFSEPIGNHTVPVGRDVQLWCKTANLANHRTAWLRVEDKQILSIHDSLITRNYRIGVIVNEASSVLTIKNVQNSDKGGYMCQINSVPMRFAVGYLDVLIPPTFERDPPDQTGALSNALQANSSGGGSEPSRDNSDTPPSSSSIVRAQEGSNATLACRARAYPEPTIQWRREDNEPIELGELINNSPGSKSAAANESIYFSEVGRSHAGAYLCIANNGVPPAASKRLVLDVQFAPIVRVPQSEVGATLLMSPPQSEAALSALASNQWGRPVAPSVTLKCYVELNPSGSFHWIKLGGRGASSPAQSDRETESIVNAATDPQSIESEQLINSDRYEIVILDETSAGSGGPGAANERRVEMRLNIRAPNKQDLGYYRCLARNQLGLRWGNVKLHEAPPSSASSSASSSSGSTFAFRELFRSGSSSGSGGELIDASGQQSGSQLSKAARSRSSSVHIRSNSRTANSGTASTAGGSVVNNWTTQRLAWIFIVAISFGFSSSLQIRNY